MFRLEKEAKAKIDYDAMFAYLGEQLTHTDIEKLRKILPDIMKEINSAFMELSLDAEAGLLIHISCCIDRLLAKQEVATNPRKAAILLQYDKEFKKLLKIVKPLEKTFHVIINDDEIANILTIIYQSKNRRLQNGRKYAGKAGRNRDDDHSQFRTGKIRCLRCTAGGEKRKFRRRRETSEGGRRESSNSTMNLTENC